MDKSETYCAPKQNITLCRYRFFTCRPAESETIDSFQTKLKKLANDCAFADLKQSLIRDMLVIGVNDPSLRERYLRSETFDLDKALTMGHAAEATRWNLGELKGNPRMLLRWTQSEHPTNQANQSYGNPCQYCGGRHQRGNCPTYGKTCTQCIKRNHFATAENPNLKETKLSRRNQ